MNRFEFFECLVRIADCKYCKPKVVGTISEAFAKLIDRLQDKYQPYPIQMFREQLLWTREVNLVLDANKDAIMKLYSKFSFLNKSSLKMSRDNCMWLMKEGSDIIKLSHKDALTCYSWSQQTC